MAPVDYDFYQQEYHGEDIGQKFFDANINQAMDNVNEWCHYYFDNHSLDDLPFEMDRINIKKAICAQVEYFKELGGTTELSRANNNLTSVNIGNFSMSNSANPGSGSLYSSKAFRYLRPTGLLYGGIGEYAR